MNNSRGISKQLRKQRKKIRKALNKIKRITFQAENKSLDLRQILDQRRDEKKTHLHPKLVETKNIKKFQIIQDFQGGLPIDFGQPLNLKLDDGKENPKKSILQTFGEQYNKGSPIHIGKPFAKKPLETTQKEKNIVQEGSSIIGQHSELNALKSMNITEDEKERSPSTTNKIQSLGPSDKKSSKSKYQTNNIKYYALFSDKFDKDIQTQRWGIDYDCIIMDTYFNT